MRSLKFIAVCLFVCVGCLEPYNPEVDPVSLNALVIEGNVDASGTSTIKLSRALPIYTLGDYPAEREASVSILSSDGEIINLPETITPGTYSVANIAVNKNANWPGSIEKFGLSADKFWMVVFTSGEET